MVNEINQTCQMLSAKTLAQMLSLSKRQIFRLNSCGKIPTPLWIVAAVCWSEGTIKRWIEAKTSDRQTFETMQEAER